MYVSASWTFCKCSIKHAYSFAGKPIEVGPVRTECAVSILCMEITMHHQTYFPGRRRWERQRVTATKALLKYLRSQKFTSTWPDVGKTSREAWQSTRHGDPLAAWPFLSVNLIESKCILRVFADVAYNTPTILRNSTRHILWHHRSTMHWHFTLWILTEQVSWTETTFGHMIMPRGVCCFAIESVEFLCTVAVLYEMKNSTVYGIRIFMTSINKSEDVFLYISLYGFPS